MDELIDNIHEKLEMIRLLVRAEKEPRVVDLYMKWLNRINYWAEACIRIRR